MDDHETNMMRALAAIHATIDNENFEVIRHCANPRQAFVKLCKHHDDAGGFSTANLFSDLVTLRLSSEGDLKDHIHRFTKLHNDLLSNLSSTPDMKILEPFIAIILINSLPPDYTPLVQSLLTSFETLTLARLYSLLNIEATRNSTNNKSNTALSVNRSSGGRKFKKKDNSSSSNPHNSSSHNTNKDTVVCSLGNQGHTDDRCMTKQWRDFKAYQDMMKSKPSSTKITDAAQLTRDELQEIDAEHDADVSYYDTAFSAVSMLLPTVLDTGASSHMFGEKAAFSSLHPTQPSYIGVASKGGSIVSRTQGCVNIGTLSLKNVLYSDQLTGNLISVGRLCDNGYIAVFRKTNGYLIDKHRRVVFRMTRDPSSDRLWHPCVNPSSHHALCALKSKTDIATLWHRCLGHAHPDAVIQYLNLHKHISLYRKDFSPCDACTMGKLRQYPSTSSFHRASRILDIVHSDIIGPINPATTSGFRYILTFVDDYTRFNHVYLLKNKNDAFVKFQHYKALIENQTGERIVKLKTDRGGEYSSDEFLTFLQKEGIPTERGPAQRPMANSVSERFNWTLLSRIRSQLVQCGLPLYLWGELALYSSHQINCSPSKTINFQTPLDMFNTACPTHHHPFDYGRLKPFGCLAFAHDRQRISKVGPVARRFVFVGIEPNARAWRLWDKPTKRIFHLSPIHWTTFCQTHRNRQVRQLSRWKRLTPLHQT